LPLVVFALGCGSPAKPTPVVTPPPVETAPTTAPKSWFAPRQLPSIAKLIPHQRWPDVPGRAIGVVWVTGRQPWGGSIDHLRNVDTHPFRQSYVFSVNRSSPYLMLWEATGGGELVKNRPVCSLGGGEVKYDAAEYNQRSRNAYGLKRRAHIVELEVNSGKGGCNVHFVATASKILDGTPEIPLDPEAVFVELRKRFDGVVAKYHDQLVFDATAVDAADVKNRKRSQYVGLLPTWIVTTRQLEVLFVYRDVAEGSIEGPTPRRVAVGVAMAARYTVDREGRFLNEQIFMPSQFTDGDGGPRDWFNDSAR
jgi:hypothetical protein